MGTPEFAATILDSLVKEYEVVLVVSQPDKEVGRKKVLTSPAVIEKAKELNLKYFQPKHIKDDYMPILNAGADMIVTAAYGQIIPNEVLGCVKKAINVHASLLPKYRGGAPIQRSIINGDKVTGISIIEMVSKLDAGVIYVKKEIEIEDSDNNTTLFEKLSYVGRDLLLDSILDIYSSNASFFKFLYFFLIFNFNSFEHFKNILIILDSSLVLNLPSSNFSKDMHLANIAHISITLLVSKLVKLNSFNDVQPANIPLISVTLPVLKLVKFIFNNDAQFLTIPSMQVTLLVLKLDRFNSFNDEHPANIALKLVALLVLKLDRFNSFNDEHPANIRLISVTSLVLKLVRFNSSINLQLKNI